jgi:hypothetical protein
VIEVVNQYFSKLEDQHRVAIESNNEKQVSMNQMLEALRQNLNEFEFLQANMEEINTIAAIKRVCVLDVKKVYIHRIWCRPSNVSGSSASKPN